MRTFLGLQKVLYVGGTNMKRKVQLLLLLIFGLSLPACSTFFSIESDAPHNSSAFKSTRDYPAVKQAPRLESFSEVAYYAPYANANNDDVLVKAKQMLLDDAAESSVKVSEATSISAEYSEASRPETSEEEPDLSYSNTDYYDEQGRLHYPIEIKPTYTFSNFVYFDFTSEECDFLEANIGNGLIHGLMVQTEIYGELMIVLKNEDRYFSCFLNGGGGGVYRFGAHKFIEGFDLVKDLDLKFPINVAIDGENYDPVSIAFGGQPAFSIDQESITREDSITVSVNELRAHFGLEPDPRFE